MVKGGLAYIVGDLGNGGQERQLLYLLRQLKTVKKDITVIVWDFNETDYHAKNYRDLGFDLVPIDKNKPLLNRILQLRKIIKSRQPVILHSFTFYLNFFCWLSCLGLKTIPLGGIRSRLTLHLHETGSFLGYLSIAFPLFKVSNNEGFRKGWHNSLLSSRLKNTYVITNHLDLQKFLPHTPSSSVVINTASIGRFTEEKRIGVIVDIIKTLKERGIHIVHSHAGKGPLEQEIRNKVQANSMQDNFVLTGEVNDVNTFLSDKHLFIHAAHTEGYPNVIMEAMACGKPIVTSDCGDVRKMVTDGENGFIHAVDDVDGIIDSCEKLIKDTQLQQAFSKKSRQLAETKFDLDHLLTETLKTYDSICAE